MNIPCNGIYWIFDPVVYVCRPWQDSICSVLSYISMLQLRTDDSDECSLRTTVRTLKKMLASRGIPFLINNRVDIALEEQLDGLHVGKDDMPVGEAASLFGGLIGASRHTPEGALQAQISGAQYIGCGPVFATHTKETGRAPLGVDGYLKVRNEVDIPVIPIGGINTEKVSMLKDMTGIVAVSSAINISSDPACTAKEIGCILGRYHVT